MKNKMMGPRVIRFLETDLWEGQLKGCGPVRAIPFRSLRVLSLAVRGFIKDNCQRTASVLTYYSMLNAVPLVAVAFAVAKGFGLEKLVERRIMDMAQEAAWQSDITNQIIGFSHSLLEHAKGGVIAGLGVILLFYTVVTILGKIENSLNSIWAVPKDRSLSRKFSDYITMMALAPVLLAVSGSIAVVAASSLKDVIGANSSLGQFSFLVFFLLALLRYCSIWALLTMLYIVMPNTRVPVRSAIVGGVAAGTMFQLVQWAYIKFQIGVVSYGAIYGSFAAVPLFLGWLQISWMIMLFGAELAHADRNYETYGFHPDYTRLGHASLRLLALKIFHLLVLRFSSGEKPPATEDISAILEMPIDLVERLLGRLVAVSLVAEVTWTGKNSGAIAFQPARPIERLSIKDFFDAWEEGERMTLLPNRFRAEDSVLTRLRELSEATAHCEGNLLVKDL